MIYIVKAGLPVKPVEKSLPDRIPEQVNLPGQGKRDILRRQGVVCNRQGEDRSRLSLKHGR